jgi:hypothetical protein
MPGFLDSRSHLRMLTHNDKLQGKLTSGLWKSRDLGVEHLVFLVAALLQYSLKKQHPLSPAQVLPCHSTD